MISLPSCQERGSKREEERGEKKRVSVAGACPDWSPLAVGGDGEKKERKKGERKKTNRPAVTNRQKSKRKTKRKEGREKEKRSAGSLTD